MLRQSATLFGGDAGPVTIELSVYCDERKIGPTAQNEDWTYLSMIAIPEDKREYCLSELNRLAQDEKHEHELAFSHLKGSSATSRVTRAAKKWVGFALNSPGGCIYSYILGIARHNLSFECFGPAEDKTGKYANVYNRFFRSAFRGMISCFFAGFDRVVVRRIYHDHEGDLEAHRYFSWHLAKAVNDRRISFKDNRIRFVNSDHREETDYPHASRFVQVADLLIGSVSQCLDGLSSNEGKIEVAAVMLPILDKLMTSKKPSLDVPYGAISFFPSRKLTSYELEDPWERALSTFFKRRPVRMRQHLSGQASLFQEQGVPHAI